MLADQQQRSRSGEHLNLWQEIYWEARGAQERRSNAHPFAPGSWKKGDRGQDGDKEEKEEVDNGDAQEDGVVEEGIDQKRR